MDIIVHWSVVIFMILFIAMIVVFNVARFLYWIKCRKIKDCSDRSCRFKIFCYKYYEVYTEEEIKRLRKMIAESGLSNEVKPREPKK